MSLYDKFGENTYRLLLQLSKNYGVDPSSSLEMEDFFTNSLLNPPETSDLAAYITEILETSFISLKEPPRWVQGSEWPIDAGQPMIFAGQIDIKDEGKGIYHDHTTLFVFINERTEPKVIIQQF
jgi:hypothetical protein